MKKYLLILLILAGSNLQASVPWMHSLEQAQKLALSTNKLILVDFYATWCGPCKMMDREAWSNPEVEKWAGYFVPLKVDVDLKPVLVRKYNIRAMPSIFILDGNGKVVYKHVGYMDAEEVMRFLKKYAVRTEYMQREALNYYTQKSYLTAILLGKKYLDFSLYLKDEPRDNFLHLAEEYLEEAKDLLDKDGDNYAMLEQKIALLALVSDLHSKNYDRVFRKISDMEKKAIHKNNRKLYNYLYYCSTEGLHKTSSKKWRTELANNKMLLKKADLLLGRSGEET